MKRQATVARRRLRRCLHAGGLALLSVVACLAAPLTSTEAHAADATRRAADCAPPGQAIRPVPWATQMLGPARVWDFTRGSDTKVAVLDSGVDGNHSQLVRHVEDGFDAIVGSGPANNDCLGSGTQVAGVIAAREETSNGFTGLAPRATIVPVRVVGTPGIGRPAVDAAALARGIDWATNSGVDVIDISVVLYADDPAVRAAVARALAAGRVVVAAVGDQGGANDANPTPYPAAYDGVIGVGAIEPAGTRWPQSQHGPYVDLVAPGAGVVTLQPGGQLNPGVNGTGVASGFVAATAALIRARRARMPSAEIARLMFATATPAPSGPDGGEYGHGVVNAYDAINTQLASTDPVALPAMTASVSTQDSAAARGRRLALAGAGAAAVAVLLVLAVAIAVPRGRRRFWRPALATPLDDKEPPEPGPPRLLFDDR